MPCFKTRGERAGIRNRELLRDINLGYRNAVAFLKDQASLVSDDAQNLTHGLAIILWHGGILQERQYIRNLRLTGEQAGNFLRQEASRGQQLILLQAIKLQRFRKLLHRVTGWCASATLETAHIAVVETGALGQFALAHSTRLTESLQCTSELITTLHLIPAFMCQTGMTIFGSVDRIADWSRSITDDESIVQACCHHVNSCVRTIHRNGSLAVQNSPFMSFPGADSAECRFTGGYCRHAGIIGDRCRVKVGHLPHITMFLPF